ncbi:MAG TPA: NAD-dependent epimerase/dehydratase family protein [Gemmatimonadaceae bacterium]|nr:NAD-dependent epimerase/dehydratase family protein [Gemmatimonadaceae bacterium]
MFRPAAETGTQCAVAEQPEIARKERDRPVVVTGASGFVGTRLCRELLDGGWKVRALVRDPVKAAARLGHLPVELRAGDIRDADYLRGALEGAGAVVHLAAIAIERRGAGETYERTNADATQGVVDVAQAVGVERFVHMSQNGADSRSPHRFLRSKGIAQDIVTGSGLRWTVLRPSVIVGPEDAFVNVLARLVKLTPGVFLLPGGGTARFQPIFVGDVVRAVRVALENDATISGMYAIGGPVPLTLRQMAERILTAMRAWRVTVGVPVGVVRPLIAVAERVLPNPPVTTELLDLLAVENTVPENAITSVFGIAPTPFAPEELLYLRRITIGEALRSLVAH